MSCSARRDGLGLQRSPRILGSTLWISDFHPLILSYSAEVSPSTFKKRFVPTPNVDQRLRTHLGRVKVGAARDGASVRNELSPAHKFTPTA